MKTLWNILQHIPPIIVVVPYTCCYWVWTKLGSILELFGIYTFKLQYWLLPECCKVTLDNELEKFDLHKNT